MTRDFGVYGPIVMKPLRKRQAPRNEMFTWLAGRGGKAGPTVQPGNDEARREAGFGRGTAGGGQTAAAGLA